MSMRTFMPFLDRQPIIFKYFFGTESTLLDSHTNSLLVSAPIN